MSNGTSTSNTARSLEQIVKDAVKPLQDQLTLQGADIRAMNQTLTSLQLETPRRTEVYDKAVMDEKLGKVEGELKDIKTAIDDIKGAIWKWLAGGASFMVIIVYLIQHVSLH